METVREVENFFGREFSTEELADLVEDLNFYTDEIKRLYELEDDTNAERTFALGTLAGNAIAGRIRERWGAKISDEQKDEIYKIGIEVARGKYPSLEILEPELDRMLAGERENSNNAENEMKKERMVFEEEEFKEMQNRRQKSVAANFVLEKLAAANIEVIADKSEMRSILDSGKLVQKMSAFHGTGGTEKSFDGYGAYVVSVNEGDAKQIGMKVASKKYGDAFYVKDQTFEAFLKEHKFSPYWAELLRQSRLDNVEELQTAMMLSDTKGNAELERQKNELSTLFKYGLVEHKREKAFVYSIDIPDDDGKNYLPYESPIGLENAEKINGALEKLGTQWRVTRNDGGRQVYFNTLSEKVFGGSQEEASKFLKDAGLVGMRMNDKNYIVFDEKDISVNKRVQFMTDRNGEIYGFAHGGKIYLDPDLMNANTPAHEYTHLWDAYTRRTNPELWERGKDIFRQTRLWNEVKGDPNYADIADDDDLVLSEVHARICGDIAQKVLERVAEQDGEIARDRAIDWDKEVAEYVAGELGAEFPKPELGSESYVSDSIRHEVARNFLAQPMKDLVAGKGIVMGQEKEKTKESALSEEDLEYIRSPEFIEKFGDWEKAKRLEKLKAAEAIVADGKIIVEGEEISENLDYLREDKNKKLLQILARNLGRQVVGIYHNDDLNIDVKVSMNNIDEIKHHNILFENHVEAIKNIPEIIQRAIYIGNESNSDKTRHPNITEYKYFATGLKIDGVDYTCKSVIGVDRNGNNYYDQSLSTIEKGRFVDIIMQKNKLGNLSPLISPWESEFEKDSNPSAYYDKRLINICQVPQMKYLDKNLMPTKEAVEAVRAGKLHIEKNGQGETMVDETRNAGTERIQKMATPAENANDIVPSARGLSEERETAERLWRAAATDYDDPIEAKEAWHNGTEEEREAISRAHAARPRNAPSGDDFVRVTAESADAGLFADMRNEMGNDPLAGNTPETLSVLRNIERLAAEAGNGAETRRLAKEFVESLKESGIRLYKSGRKNLLRMLDIRNLLPEAKDIPETVPIGEAGGFFWNDFNVRTDGGKSSYDLIAEAHGTAYRRFHAKEAMRKILAENGNDHELTEEEVARLSGAGFRSMESLGDIGRLAAEIGKEELFRKISGAAFGREEAVEKFAEENAGEHETPDHDPTDGLPHDFVPPEDKPDYIDENGEPRWLSDDEANGLKEEFSEPKKQVEFYVPESVAKVFREHPAVRAAYGQDMSEHSAEAYAGEICSILKEFSKVNPGEWNLSADEKIAVAGISREITEIMAYFTSEPYRNGKEDLGEVFSKIISTKNENGYGFAFSTGDIAQKIREGDFSQTKAETVEIMGKIESTAGNEFSGGNEKVTQSTESEKPKPQGMTVKVRDENGKAAEIRIDFGKTKVPQFAMVTQNGLKTFSEMTVVGHDAEANSWTLSNKEGEKIIVPDKTIKELVSEKQAEHAQGFDENTPAYNKMLEAQYDDFFKQRENTANNFRHNLSVYCRKEANSPLDALKVAKAIIQDMPAEERRKTKGLLNSLRRDGESVNEVIVRTYLDAVKETPLNEEHLKHGRYDKIVARPMYDMVSANGAKIDENFDLKIGDTVGGVAFKTGKTFGIGKDKIFHDCKIISSSKENNMVTLMDGDKSFYDIPRDTFLKSYAKQQRQEKKQSHKNSMRLDIER